MYKSKVQVTRGTRAENLLRKLRRLLGSGCLQLPHHDVEFRTACGKRIKACVGAETPVELKRRGASLGKATGKLTPRNRRKKLVRRPQRHGGSSGPRTLQAYFSQVKLVRGEVGVRRVVLVEAAHAGVTEEDVLEAMEADALYFTYSLDAHFQSAEAEQNESYQELLGAPEPAYAALMNRDAILSILARLDSRQRAIIEGRFFQDLSQGQVAAKLGISQMHVSRLERQTLLQLRDLLRESGVLD